MTDLEIAYAMVDELHGKIDKFTLALAASKDKITAIEIEAADKCRDLAAATEAEEAKGWKKKFEDAVAGIGNRNSKIQQLNEKHSSAQLQREALIATLKAALEEYGRHQFKCGVNNWKVSSCTCGFEQALSGKAVK